MVRAYVEPAEIEAYEAGIQRVLSALDPGAAIWLELEAAPGEETRAAIYAWGREEGGPARRVVLARCDFHPREVEADPEGVRWLNRVSLEALGRAR